MQEPFLPVQSTQQEAFYAGGNKARSRDWIFVLLSDFPSGLTWTGYDRKAVPYLDNSDVVWQEPEVDMEGDGGSWYIFLKVHQGLQWFTHVKKHKECLLSMVPTLMHVLFQHFAHLCF